MTPIFTARRTRCPASRPARAGFTLIEIMAVVTVIGLMLTLVFTGSKSLLPQTRLRAAATDIASALQQERSHAMLVQESIVFSYDFSRGGYEAYFPCERDEFGENKGPGQTPTLDFRKLPENVAFKVIRLPGSIARDAGVVTLTISPLGRVTPHEIVLMNPDYPDKELLTVRISGIANRCEILDGNTIMAPLQDADFR